MMACSYRGSICAALVMVVSWLGCGGDDDAADDGDTAVLRVAAVYGIYGAEASSTWQEVLQLAVDDMNEALEIAGEDRYRFELAFSDTGNDSEEVAPGKAIDAVNEGALAVIGSSTSDTLLISRALNYAEAPLGVPVICANCQSPRINDADREDDDPALQAASRDPDEWMFRTVANTDDVPILFDMMARECPPIGDCNDDGVFKVAVFTSDSPTGGGFRGDVQDYMSGTVQVQFDAEPGCAADPPACMRGIVENVEYDRNAAPETFDYSELVTHLLDGDNHHAEGGVPMPDDTDVYPTDFITGGALSTFEAGITIELVEQGADLARVPRRNNFRSSVVLQQAGQVGEGSYGVSPVIVVENASGDYLLEARGALELADSNFYDAAALLFLAIAQAADGLADPTTVTREQIRDSMKLVSEKQDATVVYAGPTELAKGIEAIRAGEKIDYDGASGPVDFSPATTNPEENDDAGGDVEENLEEFRLTDGMFVPGDLFDCVADPACPRVTR
jgi:hypothetical protein